MSASPLPPYYARHIFFCCNQRDTGNPGCGSYGAEAAAAHCKQRLKDLGLHGPGRARVSGRRAPIAAGSARSPRGQ